MSAPQPRLKAKDTRASNWCWVTGTLTTAFTHASKSSASLRRSASPAAWESTPHCFLIASVAGPRAIRWPYPIVAKPAASL